MVCAHDQSARVFFLLWHLFSLRMPVVKASSAHLLRSGAHGVPTGRVLPQQLDLELRRTAVG